MPDDFADLIPSLAPRADLPLRGYTVLVVEDSRFASEALRLMCHRSGARIRRADCLRSAQRHLQTYRPGIVIVDMGLPDGDGADLIQMIRRTPGGAPPVIGLSGDPEMEDDAFGAGADGFLAKPIKSLAHFQRTILDLVPAGMGARHLALETDPVVPDRTAFFDDLHLAETMLSRICAGEYDRMRYVARFLASVACDAGDEALQRVARELSGDITAKATLNQAYGLVRERLANAEMI